MVSFTGSFTLRSGGPREGHRYLCHLTEASRKEPAASATFPHFIEGDNRPVLIYEQVPGRGGPGLHRNTPHFAQYAIGGLYQLMKGSPAGNLTAVC